MTTADDAVEDTAFRFDWQRLPDEDFARWLLVHVVPSAVNDASRATHRRLAELTEGWTKVELQVVVNGVPLPTEGLLRDLEKALHRQVRHEAVGLLNELTNVSELHEMLSDLSDAVQAQVQAAARRLNVELPWDEEDR